MIYIHEPGVEVGRIQNFRSWSPWMVPDQSKASVGMEYFCFKGDKLWEMDDDALVELGKREIEQLGLAKASKVERGFVTRVPLAYPMYDADYSERVDVIKGWLAGMANLQQVGRNGLHRYNNSDHSMLTAIRAVENIVTRREPRPVGRQRRIGLPRGASGARAAVPPRARHAVRADAAARGGRRVDVCPIGLTPV